MKKSLIFKALAIVLAVVLFQLADTSESKAWDGGGCGDGGNRYYVVCYGDTLFSIGRRFNVNPYCVARANSLYDPNYIYAGQVLYIPTNCPPYPYPGHQNPCCNNYDGYYPSQNRCGGYDCNQGCGSQDCYWRSDWRGCGNDCYGQGYGQGCGNDCYQQGYGQGCGNDCYQQGAGYDSTGYYYDGYYQDYQRYSYTCGYNYNCY